MVNGAFEELANTVSNMVESLKGLNDAILCFADSVSNAFIIVLTDIIKKDNPDWQGEIKLFDGCFKIITYSKTDLVVNSVFYNIFNVWRVRHREYMTCNITTLYSR